MIKKTLRSLLLLPLLVSFFIGTAEAEAPRAEAKSEWTVPETMFLVDYYADMYHVKRQTMQSVVSCESGYVYDVPGDKRNGRYESFGLSQIHLKDHPDVSYDEAIDPHFALEFMASNISKGRGGMWTCYRMLAKK